MKLSPKQRAPGNAGEPPIGAVVVIDGEIIARRRARHKTLKSQLRHAELNAMLDGEERLWNDHTRAILFTTRRALSSLPGRRSSDGRYPHIIFGLHDKAMHVLAEESAAIVAKYDPQALKYIQTGGL